MLTTTQNQQILNRIIEEKEDRISSYSIASFVRKTTQRPDLPALRKMLNERVKPFVDAFLERSSAAPVFVRGIRNSDELPQNTIAIYRLDTFDLAAYRRGTIIVGMDLQGTCAEGILSHEYAHHHQEDCGILKNFDMQSRSDIDAARIFGEGHATGVEFTVWRALNPPELPLIEYEQLAYLSPVAEILVNIKLRQEGSASQPHLTSAILSDEKRFCLGHALFAIAEAKHGPGIYAEALRNPRVVLE